MKIAFDGMGLQSHSRNRGIGRYLNHLLTALAKRDEPLIVYGSAHLPTENIPRSFNVISKLLTGDYAEALANVAEHNPDNADWLVIGSPFELHAHNRLPHPLKSKVPLAAIAYDLIPHLFPAEYLNDKFADAYRGELEILRQYPLLMAISDATRGDFMKLGVKGDIVTIGAASDPAFFTPGPATPLPRGVLATRPYVLFLGQHEARKNLSGMIAAWSITNAELRNKHQLVIVCSSNNTQRDMLRAQIHNGCGASTLYVNLNHVTDEELRSLYRGAAAVCIPSTYEGFGLPLLEGMHCGGAMIAGANSSQIEVGGNGAMLIDVTQPQLIANALQTLMSDKKLATQYREAGIQQAAKFSWDKVAQRFVEATTTYAFHPLPSSLTPVPALPAAPSLPSAFTPGVYRFPEERFPPALQYQAAYESHVRIGRERASKASVIFCGLVRELGEDRFARFQTVVAHLGAAFATWKCAFYENDSTDGTAERLQQWSKQNPAVKVWTETKKLAKWGNIRDPRRGDQMAAYRNVYMDWVAKQQADYVVVLDSDLQEWSLDGLMSSLGHDYWDMMGSNGLHWLHGKWTQYDAWAWRDVEHFDPHHYTEINGRVYDRGHPPIPVWSCFGGMAIYRHEVIRNARYGGGDCEHVLLHKAMRRNGYGRLFVNPGQMVLYV